MVEMVGTVHSVEDIESPRIMAALQIWAAVHGAHQAAVPVSDAERLRMSAALASDDPEEIQQATATLLRPATTALTDSALVALEQAIGVSALWVEREMGAEARYRLLMHLRTELLSDDVPGHGSDNV
jgi:hypothetical protein